MFRLPIALILCLGVSIHAQDVDDIVKKAIQQTEEKPVGEAKILKVTKKANGDVETIYVIPNGTKIGIEEAAGKGMPDDRQIVNDDLPKVKANPMEGVYALVDGKKYSFKTHTPESANAALAAMKKQVVFVNSDNDKVAAPSWYKAGAPPSRKLSPLPPPPNRASQVAQNFPTIRPTSVQNVGQSNLSLPVTTQTIPTTTSVVNVARGGGIGPRVSSSGGCAT